MRENSYVIAPAAAFGDSSPIANALKTSPTSRGRRKGHGVVATRIVRTRSDVVHERFHQTYEGVPVEGADFVVHRLGNEHPVVSGTPVALGETAPPAKRWRNVSDDPDVQTVVAIIRTECGVDPQVHEIRLMLLPLADELVWTYRVRFTVPPLVADVEAFLATDLEHILLSYNIAAARHGTALAYRVNPLRTPDLDSVTLDNLNDPDDGYLAGVAVDARPGTLARLRRRGGDYSLQPNVRGFDEVQVFHHVTSSIAFFGRHIPGLAGSRLFNPVIAIANDPDSRDNSYWEPDTNSLRFGDFADRSSARSADMVFHEVGHAVSDRVCGLQRGPQDTAARGLAEGFSDYFACSALDDPRFGDYVQNNPAGARNCDKSGLRFPRDYEGKEHATGEAWANVLWDCRQQIGEDHMDAAAVESLNYLSSRSTFEDALAGLIAGDADLHSSGRGGAAHETVFQQAFDSRRPN